MCDASTPPYSSPSYHYGHTHGLVKVLDAEEYSALMRIKELKQQYRDQYSELQMVRESVNMYHLLGKALGSN
jgi:hypothetical protein